MGGEIAEVQRDMAKLVDQVAATTSSFRFAVVSYRDFPQTGVWRVRGGLVMGEAADLGFCGVGHR